METEEASPGPYRLRAKSSIPLPKDDLLAVRDRLAAGEGIPAIAKSMGISRWVLGTRLQWSGYRVVHMNVARLERIPVLSLDEETQQENNTQ